MNFLSEPKIKNSIDLLPLDKFIAPEDSLPEDSFVISRDKNNYPVSVFGDLCWDFSAYCLDVNKFRFNFAYWEVGGITSIRMSLSREIRVVFFGLIWWRNGSPLALRTLANYLIVLRTAASYAELNKMGLGEVLGNKDNLRDFIESKCSEWLTETLGSLLELLAVMRPSQLGFNLVDKETRRQVRARGKAYRRTLKQHPPMPTRIYCHLIKSLKDLLSQWLCVADEMLELAHVCAADSLVGRTHDQQKIIAKRHGLSSQLRPQFRDLASSNCINYIVSRGRPTDVRGLSAVLAEAQMIVQLLVQTFTGMREDEARCLPYGCIETTVFNGRIHYIINGRTTKLNGGQPKLVKWVTNEDGYQAVQAMQNLANVVYNIFKVDPKLTQSNSAFYPLFVSTAYFGFSASLLTLDNSHFCPGASGMFRFERLQAEISAEIEEEDLRELEHIDPHRAWRSETDFKTKQPWKFTTHQLRRSLALYAQSSGLVSLPSLRRQLQHITEAMSRYYARGSAYAKNFLGDDKRHFGLEWQATKRESEGLSYILNVLMADGGLTGGHANWVKYRIKGENDVILVDRETTMRRFKKGEMAFRETLVGGCTNTGECDKVGFRWLDVDCLRDNCKNLVCNPKKLQRVITAQENMIAYLDHTSVEYRTEMADLEVLVTARDKALLA